MSAHRDLGRAPADAVCRDHSAVPARAISSYFHGTHGIAAREMPTCHKLQRLDIVRKHFKQLGKILLGLHRITLPQPVGRHLAQRRSTIMKTAIHRLIYRHRP
jgi:hypothetical protein